MESMIPMKGLIAKRLATLRAILQRVEYDTILILAAENRRYLSGFTGEDGQLDESAGALFITAKDQVLATDSRYALQAKHESPGFDILCYDKGLARSLASILSALGTERLGFESSRMSFHQFQEFNKRLAKERPLVKMVPTENVVEGLRMIKDARELEAIRSALALSEAVFETLCTELCPGISEKQLAWTMEKEMRESGAESLAFPPIVASGPNAALPHAVPTGRLVEKDEPLLFDWGARLNGYCSDISRTIVLGKPDSTFQKVYPVVRDAQLKAIESIRPGISSQEVDRIARDHIAAKGFGEYFGHSLGHGVGLATHEKPYLSVTRPMKLEVGMVTTVEPGIYIPGWGGVRLENMVVVEPAGATVLNRSTL